MSFRVALFAAPRFLLIASVYCVSGVDAEVTYYTDEAAFLGALASQGYPAVEEGLEDDAAWGDVRTTIPGGQHTAPTVTHLGITWSSSSSNNEITTGHGPARTGEWGFFSLPHGDYENGIADGWRGTAEQSLVAIGGWVETNTPPAALVIFLDADEQNPIDFGGANVLGTQHQFFGIIDPDGFSVFDFRETEGKIGDQKFIFSDDFTFAFGGVLQDCNENGVADGIDISDTTSTDCNSNGIPDECEIDINSSAPGCPCYCIEKCAPDCNDNGVLDECEVVEPVLYSSGELTPIGHDASQSYTIPSPQPTRADAILSFTAYANLGGAPDHISVDVNDIAVGSVFGPDGSDCPESQPDAAKLVVSMLDFNDAVGGGDAVINMVASVEVDPQGCDLPTYVTVEVRLFIASEQDLNENGIPDECEGLMCGDCPTDSSGDGNTGAADLASLLACWGPTVPGCECFDANDDDAVGAADLAQLLASWGPCP